MNKYDLAQSILKSGYFTRLPIINNTVDSEIILWRTVLDVALSDLLKGEKYFREDSGIVGAAEFVDTSIPVSITVSCYMGPVTWDGLVEWFDLDNDDFITVCELAGLPPDGVYKKIQGMLND